METSSAHCHFLSLPYKSVAAAVLLGIFLGPLGLLYGSFWGALLMTVLIIPGLFMPITGSMLTLLIVFWILCSFWNVFSVSRYNKKLMASLQC